MPANWRQAERDAERRLAQLERRHVVVFHVRVPQPEASGTDLRLTFFLEDLAAAGHRVTLVSPTPPASAEHERSLRERGVGVIVAAPEPAIRREEADRGALADLFVAGDVDLAILFQWHWSGFSVGETYLPHVRYLSPRTSVAVLVDELAWVREAQRAELHGDRFALERSRGSRRREVAIHRLADIVLVLCDEDARRIEEAAPDVEIARLRYGYRPLPAMAPAAAGRDGFVFVGCGENRVNRDTVTVLVDEVVPRARGECEDVTVHLVGPEPRGGWFSGERPGVIVRGRVDDLEGELARRWALVSPIPYGTGLRSKHVTALGHGLPVITTPRGAEGMGVSGGAAVVECETVDDMAAALVRVARAPGDWSASYEEALGHAARQFGRAALLDDLHDLLAWCGRCPPKAIAASLSSPGLDVLADVPAGRRGDWRVVHVAARLDRARECLERGATDGARQELRNVLCDLQALPEGTRVFAEVHAWLARLYLADGDEAEGAAALAVAERIAPDADAVRLLRARRPAASAATP